MNLLLTTLVLATTPAAPPPIAEIGAQFVAETGATDARVLPERRANDLLRPRHRAR